MIPIVIGALGTVWTGKVKILRTNPDHPDYNIVEIGQNPSKNPEYLKRIAITQFSEKDYQLMLVWKTHKNYNSIGDSVDATTRILEDCIKNLKERHFTVASNSVGNIRTTGK